MTRDFCPGSRLHLVDIDEGGGERPSAVVAHNKTAGPFFDGPRPREAATKAQTTRAQTAKPSGLELPTALTFRQALI